MARIAILAIAMTALLSGCLGSSGNVSDVPDVPEASVPAEPAAQAEPAQAPPPVPSTPPCPTNHNNYGISITVDGLYVMTARSGNAFVFYEESNGCKQLQTEEERPEDPDTKVAEIPYPMARLLAAASANA